MQTKYLCRRFSAIVLSDILNNNELCIPLERESNVLSTEGFTCLSPPRKLKIAVLFCSIYKKAITFSAIVFKVIFIQWPMMIMSRDWVSSVAYCSIYIKSFSLYLVHTNGECRALNQRAKRCHFCLLFQKCRDLLSNVAL